MARLEPNPSGSRGIRFGPTVVFGAMVRRPGRPRHEPVAYFLRRGRLPVQSQVPRLACHQLVVVASTAAAQAEPYQDVVREGIHEFTAGNFVEARTLFERAHALKPSARTFRGLGLISYELKH